MTFAIPFMRRWIEDEVDFARYRRVTGWFRVCVYIGKRGVKWGWFPVDVES